ncbi:Actin-like protein arp9 (SWI/SNF complex component arp9) [Verticillium nonalfalfae]|uniref:Actin-like protein arp9 (SWI/SNF complex component arp9) n=1 Tax=Verticillium nonalfalfae TaxID=1051616 RepID=A0A3M9Y4S1_9PEZI|nr:Actin-like protein arp9 (SWI/SNF complex component arp9) [Verticillium nonalfalfae]RNJ55483.1 Actin-like protein arp9 (SWI/SNF complex component arp9) [Verticillium nonalfalfae]
MSTRYQRGTVDMLIELRRRLTVNLVRASKTPSHSPMTMPSRNASGSSFDFNTFLAPLADQDQDPDQEQDRDRSSYAQQQLHHFGPRHIAEPGLSNRRFQYPDPTEQSCVADSFGTPIPVRDTPSLVATAPAASYPGTPSTEKKQTKKSQSKQESKTAQGLHKAQDKQRQKRQASQPTTPAPKKPPSTPAKKTVTMSGQTGKFRDDQILVICPGSHTTMAQLGCGELTPPAHRIPTRMFKDSDSDEWRPYHTYKRRKSRTDNAPASGAEDEYEWVEDTDSDEGAVYPIVAGRIVNMNAFLAFLDHVHGLLTTTYHNTPIVLMVSPQWARPHTEMIARYIFENTRTPALCMIHSGLATTYGVRWTNATVVDIGFEKVDVSCIYEGRVVAHRMLGNFNPERIIAGGEVFTRKLESLLKDKGFTYDMAEQLKKSPIAEALPYNPEAEARMDLPTASTAGVAATAVVGDAAAAAIPDGPKIDPSKPVVEGGVDDDAAAATTTTGDNDGVLDITSIVTSGQTREFLAKKEKEKTTTGPGKGRKGKAQEAETARLTRLPNSKRTHNIFHYEEVIQEEPQQEPKPNGASKETNAPVDGNSNGNDKDVDMTDEPKTDSAAAPVSADEAKPSEPTSETAESKTDADGVGVKAEAASAPPAPESVAAVAPEIPEADTTVALNAQPVNKRVRRDIEVGLERFLFVNRDEVDRIVGTIYRTIQESVYEMYMRPACWDNIVIVGGGARLRGLRENIYQTLLARHLVSPSTATMFTSELPSNMATPTGTGSQTPTGSFTGAPHQLGPSGTTSSGVNPLLQAATTASSFGLPPGGPSTPGAPGSAAGDPNSTSGGHSYHFHSQTPTSIKLAPMPSYLTQWTKHGFEDAMFLGCLVAGRLAFTVHNLDMASLDAQRMMSLNRIEYNEMGPKGIRTHSMLQ